MSTRSRRPRRSRRSRTTDYVDESQVLNRAGWRSSTPALGAGHRVRSVAWQLRLRKVGDAARVNQALLQQGVIVRPVASYGMPEYLRVTVGLPAENERFLAALKVAFAADGAVAAYTFPLLRSE